MNDEQLTREQQTKVRKLLKTNDVDKLDMACELLNVASASQEDWIKLFPKTRILELLNTWDPGIWNTLATAMKGFPRVAEQLKDQVANRFNTYPSQWEILERIKTSRSDILINTNDDLFELINAASVAEDLSRGGDQFAKFARRLTIYAEHLSDAEAERLSKYKGYLEVRHLKELTDESGHILLCDKLAQSKDRLDDCDFPSLTELSDAAAESLGNHEGGLGLSGLTSLSDAAAESLSKHKGVLRLEGLTSLSDAAAESLSKHNGQGNRSRYLALGPTSLSDAAAESLSKHKGVLHLDGLTSLSDAAVESLSKHKGTLSLNGLTELSDAAAESLSKHEGYLALAGLTSLSDVAAESLSKHEGSLSLDSLFSLSDAAAESLSKHTGGLDLAGLFSLSDAAAESLSKHEGGSLSFCGLANLPASAAKILRDAGHNGW